MGVGGEGGRVVGEGEDRKCSPTSSIRSTNLPLLPPHLSYQRWGERGRRGEVRRGESTCTPPFAPHQHLSYPLNSSPHLTPSPQQAIHMAGEKLERWGEGGEKGKKRRAVSPSTPPLQRTSTPSPHLTPPLSPPLLPSPPPSRHGDTSRCSSEFPRLHCLFHSPAPSLPL